MAILIQAPVNARLQAVGAAAVRKCMGRPSSRWGAILLVSGSS